MVGVCRPSFVPRWPKPLARPSPQPNPGLWQVLHEMAPDPERRGSKNSILPSTTLSAVIGLFLGCGMSLGRWKLARSTAIACGSEACDEPAAQLEEPAASIPMSQAQR